ncbi:hypothetical protein D3C71_1530090 [compost metagenome]
MRNRKAISSAAADRASSSAFTLLKLANILLCRARNSSGEIITSIKDEALWNMVPIISPTRSRKYRLEPSLRNMSLYSNPENRIMAAVVNKKLRFLFIKVRLVEPSA